MGNLIPLDRPAVAAHIKRRLQRLHEAGCITWSFAVARTMRDAGTELDPHDLEYLLEMSTVIDFDPPIRPREPGVRHYTIGGTTIEGHPARYEIEERRVGRRRIGTIVRFEWFVQPKG